ncbi:MAG: class I SAM-dependent methyltransferase [Clostridia bacterium]|nr:class I SAM-dependent methyltransferase [Clostridia bacterium]
MGALQRIYYNTFMFPFEKLILGRIRKRLIFKARGAALEIGFGTGVNLNYYNFDEIDSLILLERNLVHDINMHNREKVKIVEGDAMKLPFEDGSFDTVVFTLVFCSVEEPEVGFSEIRRVLKDEGQLIFIEHVLPESKAMGRLVNKANKTWNSMSNGCNLNRETVKSIIDAGFKIVESDFSRKGVFVSGTAKKEGLQPS